MFPGTSNYFDITEMCFLYFSRITRFVNSIRTVNRRNQADRSTLFPDTTVQVPRESEMCIKFVSVILML